MTACNWQYDENDDAWDTACLNRVQIEDGTPVENDMAFCCFCGQPLVQVIVSDVFVKMTYTARAQYRGPGYLETTGYLPEGSADERESKP